MRSIGATDVFEIAPAPPPDTSWSPNVCSAATTCSTLVVAAAYDGLLPPPIRARTSPPSCSLSLWGGSSLRTYSNTFVERMLVSPPAGARPAPAGSSVATWRRPAACVRAWCVMRARRREHASSNRARMHACVVAPCPSRRSDS